MNTFIIKSVDFIFSDNQESYFLIKLNNENRMNIPFWSFYHYMSDIDSNLYNYSSNFDEWEKLTEDLISLNYDFSNGLTIYLQQFDDKQIKCFSY